MVDAEARIFLRRLLAAGRSTALVLVLAATVGIAGCGGTAGPGTSGDAGQATSAGPGGPGATTTGGGGGGGGGGVPTDVCTLLTVDEVAGALSTDPVLTAGPDPDWEQGCVYALAADDKALVLRVINQDADAYFAAMVEGRDVVDGVADGAVYSTSDRELSIKTSGVVVRIRAVYASDAVTTLDNLKRLAAIVVARLAGRAVPPEAQITAPPLVHVGSACELLTAEDVARVLGTTAVSVVDNGGPAQFCSYTLAATGEYLVGIYLDAKGGLAAWQAILDAGGTEPVEGLGNAAAYEAFNKRLNVQVGDQIMHVELYTAPDDKAPALARQLMEIMLGNL